MSSASVTVNSSNIVVNAGASGCDICVSSGDNGSSYYLAVSGVQSYTFSTSVRPLYITITKPNYIPYTAVTGGTFTTAETWFGNLHLLGTVTFTGNGSLTILPGTQVLMDGYYSLGFYDNACLIAEGTSGSPIIFTSTNGTSRKSWNRLYLRTSNNILKYCEVEYGDWAIHGYGNPSTGNVIENCIIHDNDQGIRIEKVNADINNCNIYNNRHNIVTINNPQVDIQGTRIYNGGRDGIYSYSGSLVRIYGSVIENNGIGGTSSRNGIYAGYNDVIYVGNASLYLRGKNTVRNNYSHEIYAAGGMAMVEILDNSIHDDDGYEVYNSSSSNPSIPSMENWWGESPPNLAQFYGPFYLIHYRTQQPYYEGITSSGGLSKAVVNTEIEKQITHLKNLLLDNPKSTQADSALAKLYAILRADYLENQFGEHDSFYQLLYRLNSAYEDFSIGKRALQYMIGWKILAGENDSAIKLSQKGLNKLEDRDRMGVMGNLVNLHAYSNQFDKAEEVLKQYKNQYKDDITGIEFLTETVADKKKMFIEEKSLAKDTTPPPEEVSSILPEKFQLHYAYPNPFNPQTTISFDLPEETQVEIVVYDLMGREIWKSARISYSPGTYSIVWNGVNHYGQTVGTGIYLIKLNSAKYSATRKVLLMK